MNFILKMAWRDSRSARRRLVLAGFSIVLGVAALVAIASLSANLRRSIDQQAKQLLGADLVVTSRQALDPEVDAYLAKLGGEISHGVTFTSMLAIPGASGQTRLVSVRALEGGFPYYGDFVSAPAIAATRLKTERGVAVVEAGLVTQFGLTPGETVKLGLSTFTVAGALEKIPGDSLAAGLFAPRVFIALGDVPATGLLKLGSISRFETFVKLPPGVVAETVSTEIEQRFTTARLNVETVAGRQRELGKTMRNVDAFLNLVGFIALLLGAIGVGSAVQVYIRQKLATVAVLRCLGASARQSFSIYVLQGLALGVVGSLIGAILGVGVQFGLPRLAGEFLPVPVDFFVAWSAVFRGAGIGLSVCILFTLLPLLAVRLVPPLAVLRAEVLEGTAARDPWRIALFCVMGLAVVTFSVAQAPSPAVGLGFAGVLAVSFGALTGVAWLVIRAVRKLVPKNAPYVWRQGLANLYRPHNRTVLLLVSLGLGAGLMLTLVLTRATLLGQFRDGKGDRSNLLFFDIQDDQIGPLGKLLMDEKAPLRTSAPVVTMRLTSVKGRTVEALLREKDSGIPAWTLRREYRSTYRSNAASTETVTKGTLAARVAPDIEVVPISLEESLARDMKVTLDDELIFDVQGVPIKTKVSSLRAVDWRRMEPNFFVVFPEGVLEAAPKFHLAALRAETPSDSARIQQLVTKRFPNVSAIDLGLVLQTLDGILARVEFVVQFMVLFTVGTGMVVLAGAILSGRSQRLREMILLRILGATQRQLTRIQLVEYLLVGLLAALTGSALAICTEALLARFLFEAPIVVPAGALATGIGAITAATVLTGWVANRSLAKQPPLAVLRKDS